MGLRVVRVSYSLSRNEDAENAGERKMTDEISEAENAGRKMTDSIRNPKRARRSHVTHAVHTQDQAQLR